MHKLLTAIGPMLHSTINNYIKPGLTSCLVGGTPTTGKVRLFVNEAVNAHHGITPHSHRFDFACIVLRGSVINTIYTPTKTPRRGSMFAVKRMTTAKDFTYNIEALATVFYSGEEKHYVAGDTYEMPHYEIHTIHFSPDAVVLFFEGPELIDHSILLESRVNGETIETFQTPEWMFQKASVTPSL